MPKIGSEDGRHEPGKIVHGSVPSYVQAAVATHGRRLLVVDPAEVDNDLVRDVTEMLTSRCARRYGRRAGADGARRAIDAATGGLR